jgi:hypothetical protein
MKTVTTRTIVRTHARQLAWYAATLALGLPAIALLVRLLDPAAPFAYIALPVVAGGLLPAFALLRTLPSNSARCSAVRARLPAKFPVTVPGTVCRRGAGSRRYRARTPCRYPHTRRGPARCVRPPPDTRPMRHCD